MKLHVLNNQRPEVCAPCGGKCCHNAPGAYFPGDFGETDAEIRAGVSAALLAGTVALSDYDDDPYVRAPIKGQSGLVQEIYISRLLPACDRPKFPCANLTDSGCALEFDRRPTLCRALEPDPAGKVCRLPSSVENDACRESWGPFLDLFNEIRS